MTQAVVIGGGLAGAALGARLTEAGRDVVVLERETTTGHKVCGEFLSYESNLYLARLGIDLPALGAVSIERVSLFSGRSEATTALPFKAFSLSRKALDHALLNRAAALGADVRRGVRATALTRLDGGWQVQTDADETIVTPDLFLAVGKHDLRDWKRPLGLQSDLIGFKLHWRLQPRQTAALRGAVELHLFAGGYAGLELVEDDAANLCLLVRRSVFAQRGRSWSALLAHLLQTCAKLSERLDGATPSFARPLAVSAVPYGHVQRRSGGLWRLGDQAAVIPSFAGDGMSIALHSAHLGADLFLRGQTAQTFQSALARDVGAQVVRATLLSKLLVLPWAQPSIAAAVRLQPALLAAVAGDTRISQQAMARALE
ncbi:MAG: NAD(P)/FAD-dependent oxidoreductase [Caulobacteraceae bacterium]